MFESVKSYSGLVVAIFMSVTADYLLYKPNLIFLTIWSCFSYSILIGFPSLMMIRVSNTGWIFDTMISTIIILCKLPMSWSRVRERQRSTLAFTNSQLIIETILQNTAGKNVSTRESIKCNDCQRLGLKQGFCKSVINLTYLKTI